MQKYYSITKKHLPTKKRHINLLRLSLSCPPLYRSPSVPVGGGCRGGVQQGAPLAADTQAVEAGVDRVRTPHLGTGLEGDKVKSCAPC